MRRGSPRAWHLSPLAATDTAPHAHIGIIPLILIALAALAVYAAVVLLRPMPRCPRCKGKRVVIKKRKGKRPRTVRCRRCRATGRAPWRGARLIHRMFWGAFGDPIRERLRGAREE